MAVLWDPHEEDLVGRTYDLAGRDGGANERTEDLTELYRGLSDRVRELVRFSVRAPDAVIDDACQTAWSRLLRLRTRVRRETALSWLVTTANREALKALRRTSRELPLEALGERPHGGFATPEQAAEFHERLDQLRVLPRRQQQMLWLQGLGLSYTEMAAYTGDTERTVERQLMRGKRALERLEAA